MNDEHEEVDEVDGKVVYARNFTFGTVRLKRGFDYDGRETLRISVEPRGRWRVTGRLEGVEAQETPPADFPDFKALRKRLVEARQWLRSTQPDDASYPTHFGVRAGGPLGCVDFSVAPGYVWTHLVGERARHSVNGMDSTGEYHRAEVIRPFDDMERATLLRAVNEVFGALSDWHGPDWYSFTVPGNIASDSNRAAYANYQAFSGRGKLLLPDGWS